MKEQDELAETILALPGHNLSVSNGDEMLILDLYTLQSLVRKWKELRTVRRVPPKGKGLTATMRNLAIGDWFELAGAKTADRVSPIAKRLKIKVTTRRTDAGLKVWRVS